MITLEQAKNLKHGETLYHTVNRNADGSAQRWQVNGKPKTWKRTDHVSVPVKNGLRNYGYLTEHELNLVCLSEEEALN